MTGQAGQQLQLLRRCLNDLALDLQFIAVHVKVQIVKVVNALVFLLFGGGAAQHGLDAGRDLLGVKRLDDVVVGAQFQAQHLVVGLALGGEHDDGGVVLGAELAADLPAVHDRHHNVQQHKIRVQLVELCQRCAAVVDHRHVVALLDQIQSKQLADIFIVINDQNFLICHLSFLLARLRRYRYKGIIPHNCGQKKNRSSGFREIFAVFLRRRRTPGKIISKTA